MKYQVDYQAFSMSNGAGAAVFTNMNTEEANLAVQQK